MLTPAWKRHRRGIIEIVSDPACSVTKELHKLLATLADFHVSQQHFIAYAYTALVMVSWGLQVLETFWVLEILWSSLFLQVSLLSPRGIVSTHWEVSTCYQPYQKANLNIRKQELSVSNTDFTLELRFVATRGEKSTVTRSCKIFPCHESYILMI